MDNGESMSVVRDAGLNSTSFPVSRSIGRAVPYFHPGGTRKLVWYWTVSGGTPSAYNTYWFQLRTASSVVVELAEEKPSLSGGESTSNLASMEEAPCGTST